MLQCPSVVEVLTRNSAYFPSPDGSPTRPKERTVMSDRTTALSRDVSGEPEFPAHSQCDEGVSAVPGNRVDLVSRRQLEGCRPWQDAFASQHKDRRYYEIVEDTLHPEFDYRYFA